MEPKIEKATNEKREKAAFVPEKKELRRKCPQCEKVWDNPHVTICLDCGAGTRQYEGE